MIKITDQVLHIPPFISTAWKNVLSLQAREGSLVIELISGSRIEIPGLEKPALDALFMIHSKHLETRCKTEVRAPLPAPPIEMIPILQHDEAQRNAPSFPKEIAVMAENLSQTLRAEEKALLAEPKTGCNCPHCQILRLIKGEERADEALQEEIVSDEDLQFKTWDIHQESEKCYSVVNPLDKEEKYTVFLGSPVGCTCGCKKCEHIEVVLKS